MIIKVWVTKYALSNGIELIEADHDADKYPRMVTEISNTGYRRNFHVEGRDWHRTEESANKRAEKMRVNKIASLQKQIDKLKTLSF